VRERHLVPGQPEGRVTEHLLFSRRVIRLGDCHQQSMAVCILPPSLPGKHSEVLGQGFPECEHLVEERIL